MSDMIALEQQYGAGQVIVAGTRIEPGERP